MLYELTYLISPDLNQKQVEELAEKIKNLTTSQSEIKPKRIKLAYSIQKKGEAFLTTVGFTAEPSKALEINKKIEKIPKIIRFILIKKQPEKPKIVTRKPSAIKKETEETIGKEKKEQDPKKKVDLADIEKELEKVLGE